jgi:Tfp pilus assembly protein PilO
MRLRISLFVAAGAGIALLWYFFLITPAHRVQAQLQADLTATQIQIEDFQTTLNQLPVFLQTREGINRKITEINARLFSRQEMLDLFDHVERLAQDHGLSVSELAPRIEELLALAQTQPTPGHPQVLSLDIRLLGDYLSFGQFVETLEKQAYFRAVDKCLISDSPDLSGRLLFDFKFKALLETAPRIS